VKNNYLHRLRVFIPAPLDKYISDYHKNWCHEPVTVEDINNLEKELRVLQDKNPNGLLEMKHTSENITQAHYDMRHNEEVAFSDEVFAFQVNNSTGTQDTITKAQAAGLPVTLHKKYTI
jgi:hypothetical protein